MTEDEARAKIADAILPRLTELATDPAARAAFLAKDDTDADGRCTNCGRFHKKSSLRCSLEDEDERRSYDRGY